MAVSPSDAVILTRVQPTHVSASFEQCWEAQAWWLARNRPSVLEGGSNRVRYGSGGLPSARNRAVTHLLESDVEWMWFVDTDMGFEPDTVSRLLDVADPVERPIVGALTFAMSEVGADGMGGFRVEPRPCLYDWVDGAGFRGAREYPRDQLTPVSGLGTGCVLLHRSVFERVGPYPYNQLLNPADGRMLGEDMSFCVRALQADIPMFVDTSVKTTHHKEVWLGEALFDVWQAGVESVKSKKSADQVKSGIRIPRQAR